MTQFAEIIKEFNAMIEQARFVEALDTFYGADIISAGNDQEPIKGLADLRKAVEKFIADTDIGKIDLLSSIVDENLSVAHWHYIFTHKKLGEQNYRQLSVQRWKNGKIIQENHFYNL